MDRSIESFAAAEHRAQGGQRDLQGRLMPRSSNAGRKPRPDLLVLAQRAAMLAGIDLEEATWQVVQRLHEKALEGDVQAMKLWLERFTAPETLKVEVEGKLTLEAVIGETLLKHRAAKEQDLLELQ